MIKKVNIKTHDTMNKWCFAPCLMIAYLTSQQSILFFQAMNLSCCAYSNSILDADTDEVEFLEYWWVQPKYSLARFAWMTIAVVLSFNELIVYFSFLVTWHEMVVDWQLTCSLSNSCHYRYSRVHISSDTAFLKILKKPSIVQE